jgi:hypothetical protein
MKISPLVFPLFFAAAGLAAPRATPAVSPHLSLRFEAMPLGNVARILSAQFNAPVTIAANARAPITGDFSKLDLKEALAAAGRQTGLVVLPLGRDASAGFALSPPVPESASATPAAVRAAGRPANSDSRNLAKIKIQLESAARRRAALLRQRADLLEQSADSDPES